MKNVTGMAVCVKLLFVERDSLFSEVDLKDGDLL